MTNKHSPVAGSSAGTKSFEIFRAVDAPAYAEANPSYFEDLSPTAKQGLDEFFGAGADDGAVIKVLFSIPGFDLVHCWFKAGYPLPRHSHAADCLYYVVAGSLSLGSEVIGPGDGFFIPANMPYTHVPGEQGVELLEIRSQQRYGTKVAGGNAAYWKRIVEQVRINRSSWQTAQPPGLANRPSSQ